MNREENPEIEFFSQLYDALTEGPSPTKDLRKSLEEQGVDVAGTVDAGLRLIEDHKRRLSGHGEQPESAP